MGWKLGWAAVCAAAIAVNSAWAGPFGDLPDAAANVKERHVLHKAAPAAGCAGPSVTIGSAVICGAASTRAGAPVDVYGGIPYANALRWQYSATVAPVSMNATGPGPICWQKETEQQKKEWPARSEQCLNLNVWLPHGAAPNSLPVMVFIHGGSFISGHGSSPLFDGSALAQQGVVVVTLNYRLGALGFLASNVGLTASGNFGLDDQQNALKWVQSYIAAFGGNPAKVTLFGESAGAMSVGLHLFSVPSSTSLFSAAMMESNPMGAVYNTQAQFETSGNDYLGLLCSLNNGHNACDANWYQNIVSASQVLTAQDYFLPVDTGLNGLALLWAPLIDNVLVKNQPFAGYAPGSLAKPFVFGANRDEGVVFAAAGGGSGTLPSMGTYETTLKTEFGQSEVPIIMNNPPYNLPVRPYCYTSGGQQVCYYSNWGQSLTNVLTDYSFATGNLLAAMQSQGAFIPPVFAYVFTQAPAFDFYAMTTDHGACQPAALNVCHGNELPYVFNTLSSVPTPNSLTPGDQTLANIMTADWAAFAKQPLAPGADWQTPFSGTLVTNATGFGNDTVTQNVPFFPNSYESFWKGLYPSGKGK